MVEIRFPNVSPRTVKVIRAILRPHAPGPFIDANKEESTLITGLHPPTFAALVAEDVK